MADSTQRAKIACGAGLSLSITLDLRCTVEWSVLRHAYPDSVTRSRQATARCHRVHRAQRLWRTWSTHEAKADKKSVVSKIISGEYSNPIRVGAFNTIEGWSRDVTEGIALAVLEREASDSDLSEPAKKYVDRALETAAGS